MENKKYKFSDLNKIHVLPTNDLKEHEESNNCSCKPTLEYIKETVIIIHNSFDGREKEEKRRT